MSLTIHHAPQSRSTRLLWLLEELGADYDIHYVEIERQGGQGHADPSNPHPLKQAPSVSVDGQLLIESVLIFLFLTDRFPEAKMAPGPHDPRRAEYLSWLGLYNNEPYDSYAQRIGGRPALKRAWAKDSPEGHV